jgi:hypothetical protein
MTDAQLINSAYEATSKHLFTTLFRAYTTAKTRSDRDQAEKRFQAGVKLDREARDQAKKLV